MDPIKIPSLHDLSMLAQHNHVLAQCLDFYERRIYTFEQALLVAVVTLADQLENTEKLLEDQTGGRFSARPVDQDPQQ